MSATVQPAAERNPYADVDAVVEAIVVKTGSCCAASESLIATAPRTVSETRARIASSQALIRIIRQALERSGLRHLSHLTTTMELAALTRLQHMTARFSEGGPLAALLEDALDALMRVTEAPCGNIQLLNPEAGTLSIATQQGFRTDFLDFFATVPARGSACGIALHERRRVVVPDVAADPAFTLESRRAMLRANARAVQSTPLVGARGDILGVVSTHWREPRVAQTRALCIVGRYARQIAALIESRPAIPRFGDERA